MGNQQLVDEQCLSECFAGVSVQAVILSACQSAKQHPDYPDNGLSQCLHRAGIPHVIGMRESLIDKAGIQFASAFFSELSKQNQPASIDSALQHARLHITQPFAGAYKYIDSDPHRQSISYGQWCLPLQYSQDVHHPLLDWSFTPQPKQREYYNQTLDNISLPQRFIGRRRELRQWQNALR